MGRRVPAARASHARAGAHWRGPSPPARAPATPLPFPRCRYVVITSVDRDDIADGGAGHFADVVREVKARKPSLRVECLTPDFNGTSGLDGVAHVAASGLDVYAHNIETVERTTKMVRDRRAGYRESLAVLEHAKVSVPGMVTKTSIMLGCGEEEGEVRQAMRDALDAGVEIFTLGQYLRRATRPAKPDSHSPLRAARRRACAVALSGRASGT